ncbi:hypothetical protein OWV82_000786 [Melia azedarach]|uniref:Uncharacterized protein n=1 Tax=Melia azedarach TaxID=155640 RepID=A0ACC1YVA5_MELAZ|nr:hypothetical protein OWV82_000786 [Melia azedarach]
MSSWKLHELMQNRYIITSFAVKTRFFPTEYMSPVCLTSLTVLETGFPALSLYGEVVFHHVETVGIWDETWPS